MNNRNVAMFWGYFAMLAVCAVCATYLFVRGLPWPALTLLVFGALFNIKVRQE